MEPLEPTSLPTSPTELFSLPEDSVSVSEDAGQASTQDETEQLIAEHNGFPSIGSMGHFAGQCTRCCFHPKGRCLNGYDCKFCHFEHDARRRKKKTEFFQNRIFNGLPSTFVDRPQVQIQHVVSPPMPLPIPP